MKLKCLFTIIVSLGLLYALMLLPTSVLAVDNLAANGDLEMGSTNGWEISSAAIDSTVKHGGSYSLKLNATSAWSGAAFKTIPVRKNATVTVSFYYRYAQNPSGNLYHVFTYKGENPWTGAYSSADASFAATASNYTQWKQASYTFNSGEYDAIYLKFCPAGNGSVPCYIDDLVVTAVGGDQPDVEPYLTSFGTKYNRPHNASDNLLVNGGFEAASGAQWNTASFIKDNLSVVEDSTAPDGSKSLYFGGASTAVWHTFPVTVEKNTQYTFSAWVKSPRLSATNNATATFGVMNAQTGKFLVYEPYNGNGYGSASLSTETMQLMSTAPDGEWHLRSVTFNSGSHTTIYIGVYGATSRLYLDDMALYKSAYGVEYVSPLRSETITATTNTGHRYCVDEDSLIPAPHMTGEAARQHWSANPAWRNGFLSFEEVGDGHGNVLKYTASAHTEWALHYVDWIDVQPGTDYTLTMDVKRLSAGGGRIALLDDNVLSPAEFYALQLDATDGDWVTYSITFNTGVYSRIGFAVVDGGGAALMDKIRLFKSDLGVAEEPTETDVPVLKPVGGKTSVMEMGTQKPTELFRNGGFEQGSLADYIGYQSTSVSANAAHTGAYGAHLKGNGGWDALLEQVNLPVKDGSTYVLTYWYKAQSGGANVTLFGSATNTQYAYEWASKGEWTQVTATFTVEGDAALWLNFCGGGSGIAEDVYVDDISLVEQDPGALLGVAFLMELDCWGVTRNERMEADYGEATVDVFADGQRYRLVGMGALMTNRASVGTDSDQFNRENGQLGERVVDVPAVYLYDVGETSVTFAVRIINVPRHYANAVVYARPYYVYEKNGQQIVVYGSIYSRSYNNSGEDILLD